MLDFVSLFVGRAVWRALCLICFVLMGVFCLRVEAKQSANSITPQRQKQSAQQEALQKIQQSIDHQTPQNRKQDSSLHSAAQEAKNPANPYNIDYPNLSPKYYPYIQSRNLYYDSDIIHIIHKVDKAERKNAFFIGGAYGMNGNVALPLFSSTSIIGMSAPKFAGVNAGLFGFRAGYQKFTGKMLPIERFGYQVYIDFCVSFGRNGLFFTALNVDMLWDFLEFEQFVLNLNAGVGVGGAKIAGLAIPPYSDRYEAAYRLNLGMSARFQNMPHKIGFYFGSTQALMRGFLGYTLMIGYDYVF